MGFFSRRKDVQQAAPLSESEDIILNGHAAVDPVIRACGRTTEHILQEVFSSSMADILYTQRWLIEQREKEFPGYRDEVNRQRVLAGLPPI